ncbi:MAG: hypothetical protein AVDCRST_MAG66-2107 [uncultured Pseudonocardia sp.]|uniref:Luciferase-like domain-containing protein n=1 Tax=uncultured Pseudonocardia sp. TaxID=211455 RepID=A0A6J4PFE8_9PSEU|nr:MAG: hypothetical protein AVDCRST_MAG66-2107 [uncultured Pseudonocardia sp.]
MELSVSMEPLDLDGAPVTGVLDLARRVESAGLAGVAFNDHVLRSGGRDGLDPLVALAGVAAVTTTIELTTSILVVPLRGAAVLAAQCASLDVLSGGRFVLGTGAGWRADDFAAAEVPLSRRGALTDSTLDRLRHHWSAERTSGDALAAPTVTPGGPRIRIGGHSDAALRRAVRIGDGWHASGLTATEVAASRSRIEELGAEQGRQPGDVEITVVRSVAPPGAELRGDLFGPPLGGRGCTAASVLDDLAELAVSGVSGVVLYMPVAAAQLQPVLDWLAADVVPAAARLGAPHPRTGDRRPSLGRDPPRRAPGRRPRRGRRRAGGNDRARQSALADDLTE